MEGKTRKFWEVDTSNEGSSTLRSSLLGDSVDGVRGRERRGMDSDSVL